MKAWEDKVYTAAAQASIASAKKVSAFILILLSLGTLNILYFIPQHHQPRI
jgi:hypothetical protein